MSIKSLSMYPAFSDSMFSDRFNRIDRLFSHLTGDTPVSSIPPYNLRQINTHNYELTACVAGWKESELEIETVGGQLTITGKPSEEKIKEPIQKHDNNEGWIHKGINKTEFKLTYSLPEHGKVNDAKLINGLLYINIHLDVPEHEKPKKISIQNKSNILEHEKS